MDPKSFLIDGEHFADLLAVGDVHLDGGRAPSHLPDLLARLFRVHDVLRREELCERRLRRLRPLFSRSGIGFDEDVGDDDVRAGARKRQAVRPSQPARSAGDDGDLAGQLEHATLLDRLVMAFEELTARFAVRPGLSLAATWLRSSTSFGRAVAVRSPST